MNNRKKLRKGVKVRKAKAKRQKPSEKVQPRLPILCRPGAEMSAPLYYIGWALRSLVLFCGIMGLCLFIGDGLGFYGEDCLGSVPTLAIVSLALTVICSAAAWNKRTVVLVPIAGIVLGIGTLFIFTSNPFLQIWDGIRCLVNNSMLHMADLGYTSFGNFTIGSFSYFGGEAQATDVGFAVLATVFAVILALSLLRRVHAVVAVITSVIVIMPIFMYNLTQGNSGVSLVLIFIFGELSLLFYERKFSNYEAKKLHKKAAKAEKKRKRIEAKKARKEARALLDRTAAKAYAITLELTGEKSEARKAKSAVYRLEKEKNNSEKKALILASKKTKKDARAEKKAYRKAASIEKKNLRKAKKAEKKEYSKLSAEGKAQRDRERLAAKKAKSDAVKETRRKIHEAETVTRKTLSASGYAGGTAILAAALAVWLPFSAITGNFMVIDFINNPVSVAREYVTAYLRGDDIDLNNMGDLAELTPRTLTYDSPEYKQIQMLAVETEITSPVYIRGWVGMRFDTSTGTWSSGTSEDVVEYRKQFGKDFVPDTLKTKILGTMLPTSVAIDDVNTKLKFADFGFDVRQIHLRRINGESLIIYTPPTVNSDLGILEYSSIQPNEARYSHYFESIFSSRFFKEGVNYSTVSFMNVLNGKNVSNGLTSLDTYTDLYVKYMDIYFDALKVLQGQSSTEAREYDTGRGKVIISVNDFSDLDRLFLAECKRNGCPDLMGYSPFATFLAMTEEEKVAERAEFADFTKTEEEYREWAYLHYSSPSYSRVVTEIAEDLLSENGYKRNKKVSGNTPLYENLRGGNVNQHDVIMTAINYLRDNYTYTLDPVPYTGETEMSVLDSFLSQTKNGYCTHFATAAAMLIREFGYSVRYCEGYLVNDFNRNIADDAPALYKGYALDENAHAWIEVYYPSIGWVAYETVPEYMSVMYDPIKAEIGEGGEIIEELPEEDQPLPEEETPEEEQPAPEEEKPLTPEVLEEEEEQQNIDQFKLLMIVCISVASAILMFFILRFIIKRIMKKAEKVVAAKYSNIVLAMDTERLISEKTDTLPIAKEFDTTVFRIFEILGYPPRTGEQLSEYAARLENDFGGITDYSVTQVFELIGKTEFGNGLSPEEMYVLADFTDRLTSSSYAGLSLFEKIKYRYFKRII